MSKPLNEIYGPFHAKPELLILSGNQEMQEAIESSEEHIERICTDMQRKVQEEEARLKAIRDELNERVPKPEHDKVSLRKLDWTLLPFDALEEVVVAFQVGRDKHPGEDDWSCGLHSYRDMAGGLLRHFNAWMQRTDNDPDGFLHMAGIAARALMLVALYLRHTPDVDDR